MSQTVSPSSPVPGEKMAPPSISILPGKKSPTNVLSSPARTGKSTPSNSEKKPQINGHASPSHLTTSAGNLHGGKQMVEGYMKTDDRMRLAKERREEREKSLAAREQLIKEKERRARLQYERTVEERWRRLEEQRQKEELRRAAVEEKRRQQLEEERERLEALMKRSLERSLQLEQRNRRWHRGCMGAGDSENASLPFSAASAFSHGIASPLPAVSESAPCSPHRSPFRTSVSPADHGRAARHGGSQSTPNTPKKERLRRDRTASPGYRSPLRRSESPASVTKHLSPHTPSKLVSKVRSQSPISAHPNHCSPTRQRQKVSSDDRKLDGKKMEKTHEMPKTVNTAKKNSDVDNSQNSSQALKTVISTSNKSPKRFDKTLKGNPCDRNQSPDRRNHMSPKLGNKNHTQDGEKKEESSHSPSMGKVAGTTNAEEASRLLAARRRQARAQKEQEEKHMHEQEEEERRRAELLRKQQEQQQQEKLQRATGGGGREESNGRLKQDEDRLKREAQEREHQMLIDRERERAKVQARQEAERQRQDREHQAQQEEEERLLRKKRIEEIMKRTRKGDADLKGEQTETKRVSRPDEVTDNDHVNCQVMKKIDSPVHEQVSRQVTTKECTVGENEAFAQMDNRKKGDQSPSNTGLLTPTQSVPDKKTDVQKNSSDDGNSKINKEDESAVSEPRGRDEETNRNKMQRVSTESARQIIKVSTKASACTKVSQSQSVPASVTESAMKSKGSGVDAAGGRKRQTWVVSEDKVKTKERPKMEVRRPAVTPLPLGDFLPPVIKLEPLDVKREGSSDDVQPMEVSPASKEELISIPEFSPIHEIQHCGISNTRALEDLMDLTGSVTYPKLSADTAAGDCNKNLIEGIVSPMSDSKLMGMCPPASNKLSIQ